MRSISKLNQKRVMYQTRKTRQLSLLRLERQGKKILDVIKEQKLVSNLSFDKESQRSIQKYFTQNIYCSMYCMHICSQYILEGRTCKPRPSLSHGSVACGLLLQILDDLDNNIHTKPCSMTLYSLNSIATSLFFFFSFFLVIKTNERLATTTNLLWAAEV